MSEKYDSASIKKIVGWLDEREQKMKKELDECRKKNPKRQGCKGEPRSR